jgi:hypothetical protein
MAEVSLFTFLLPIELTVILDKKRSKLIHELTSYNFMPTFNSMRNKRHTGTAEWCFHTPEYQEWANANKTAILHITGKSQSSL